VKQNPGPPGRVSVLAGHQAGREVTDAPRHRTAPAPAASAPSQTAPGPTVPGPTVPSQTVPSQTVPSQTVPSRAVPSQTVPSQAVPSQTVPTQPVPGSSQTTARVVAPLVLPGPVVPAGDDVPKTRSPEPDADEAPTRPGATTWTAGTTAPGAVVAGVGAARTAAPRLLTTEQAGAELLRTGLASTDGVGPGAQREGGLGVADFARLQLDRGVLVSSRYLLTRLLWRSDTHEAWQAVDQTLVRDVRLTALPASDVRADRVLDAARRAALVHDQHFLRVFDADRATAADLARVWRDGPVPSAVAPPTGADRGAAPGTGPAARDATRTGGPRGLTAPLVYVIEEWVSAPSLQSLLHRSPLPARQAVLLTIELAEALAAAHAQGMPHGFISPDRVLVSANGSLRISGLRSAAVLTTRTPAEPGSPAARDQDAADAAADVRSVGAVLYAALTARWPLGGDVDTPTESLWRWSSAADLEHRAGAEDTLRPAPRAHGRVLAPRQVRPGIPRKLDEAVLRLLGHPVGDHPAVRTPAEALDLLTRDVLGSLDRGGVIPALRDLADPGTTPERTVVATADRLAGAPLAAADGRRPREPAGRSVGSPAPLERRAAVLAWEGPEARIGDGGDAAPDPVGRVPGDRRAPDRRLNPEAPPRHRLRPWLVAVVVLALLAAATALVVQAFSTLSGRRVSAAPLPAAARRTVSGGVVGRRAAQPAQLSVPSAVLPVVPIRRASDFDPPPGNGQESPDLVGLAVDGDDATAWTTVTYAGRPDLGGLKPGVGLVLDLGSAHAVRTVSVVLTGAGTDLDIRTATGSGRPTALTDFTEVAAARGVGARVTLTAPAGTTARWLLVWLTRLPQVGVDSYRGGIADVVVRGAPTR